MEKAIKIMKAAIVMLGVLIIAGGIWLFMQWREQGAPAAAVQEAAAENAEKNADGTAAPESGNKEDAASSEITVTEEDVQELEKKLAPLETQEREELARLEFYRSLPERLPDDEIQEIAQSRILQCYEENVVLAAEAKTVLIGGLGVSISSGYEDEDAMAAYGDYLKEELGISGLDSADDLGDYLAGEIADGVIGQIGSAGVQNAVRYGLDGAVEAYKADGSLSSALEGAVDSVVDGVVADIQEYPYKLAENALNEMTGGLFGVAQGLAESDSPEDFLRSMADDKSGGLISSIASAVTYESSPTALFQSMSETASASAVELSAFLEKGTINSGDIANMMYQYSQYGEVLHDLNGYNWSDSYSDMEQVYTRFVSNEVMIEMLGGVADTGSGQAAAEQVSGNGVTEAAGTEQISGTGVTDAAEAQEDSGSGDADTEAEQDLPEGSPAERYEALTERIAKLEEEIPAYQEESGKLKEDRFNAIYDYREQTAAAKEKYSDLIDFSVKNFEAQYDVGGSKIIEDNKKINHAIGELSKYTPWGITLGLFSSMAMEDGNADYEAMVEANTAFGTGMQAITVDTKEQVERFNGRLRFYEALTEGVSGGAMEAGLTEEEMRRIWENQYLLAYMLDGEEISLDAYADEVRKKLYIMGAEVYLVRDYYRTLLASSDSKTKSIDDLAVQYQEIMAVADPDGTGEIAAMVSVDELREYLVPLIDAGIAAEKRFSAISQISPLVQSKDLYAEGGKVHWYYKAGLMQVTCGPVFFAGGEPVYIAGYYYYRGMLLNDDGKVDGDALFAAAQNLTEVKRNSVAAFWTAYYQY